MRLSAALTVLFLAPTAVLAGWGYSDDGKNYVIDTNANLVVKVSKTNGDMTSIKYRGVEYSGQNGKFSHVESGLGKSAVTIKQFTDPNVIKVNIKFGTLKHDLVFRYGNPNVYIFMNKADKSVTPTRTRTGFLPMPGLLRPVTWTRMPVLVRRTRSITLGTNMAAPWITISLALPTRMSACT
jgi:hypothetical protein